MKDVTNRFLEFYNYLKNQGRVKNASEFAGEIGVSSSLMTELTKGRTKIGVDALQNTVSKYRELNLNWLFSGDGDMLQGDRFEAVMNGQLNAQLNVQPVKRDKKAIPTGKMPLVITVDPAGQENVVYVGIKARAGYLVGHGDPEYVSHLPSYRLPGADHGTYRIFEADGVSMDPTIKHGDKVIGRWVEDLNDIRDNRIHIIVTHDGVLIKRVLNRLKERGKLYLKSDTVSHRHEFETIELDPSDVVEVWYAQMNISYDFREPGEIYRKVNDLEIDIMKIKELLTKKYLP